MAWTTPITWTAGQVVGASDLNAQIRDNELYLYNRPTASLYYGNAAYTINGQATDIAVDSTHVKLTATISSGRAFVIWNFWGSIDNTAHNAVGAWGTLADATSGTATFDIQYNRAALNVLMNFTTFAWLTGLSVGSHTFYLAWHNDNSAGVSQSIPAYNILGWLLEG